jgi:Zeta toxin
LSTVPGPEQVQLDPAGRGDPGRRPVLVLLRGNSGSGKSVLAAEIRARHGRGLAIVGQDNLRRVVVIEGILSADHYGAMLARLLADFPGRSHAYYLDVQFDETLRRHAGKPEAGEFGEREMRRWYRERDLLPGGIEQVIPAESTLEQSVRRVLSETGLSR